MHCAYIMKKKKSIYTCRLHMHSESFGVIKVGDGISIDDNLFIKLLTLYLLGFVQYNNFNASYFCTCLELRTWFIFPTLIFLYLYSFLTKLFVLCLDLQFSFSVSFYSSLLFSCQCAFYSTSFYLLILKKLPLWHIFHILLPHHSRN